MDISVLEFGDSEHNLQDFEVLEGTVQLVQKCEAFGYKRFWLGEHHEPGSAWRSPEILLPILAAYTNTIRIGSAGMLLPINSPLRIAQNFKMLSAIFPNRIDLGIAKGVAPEHISNELLNGLDFKTLLNDHLPRVKKVIDFLKPNVVFIDENLEKPIFVPPNTTSFPEVWLLGSSGTAIPFAIEHQLCFSLSLFHFVSSDIQISQKIFQRFQNEYMTQNGVAPTANIAITVGCGENKAEVDKLLSQHKGNYALNIIGEVNECCEKINAIAEQFKTEEVVILLNTLSFASKEFYFERIAEQFGLQIKAKEKSPEN